MSDDLEAQIAEQRRLAEQCMNHAARATNPHMARALRNRAAGHYSHMAGLISRRSDERVEQMERERGLR